MGYLSSFATAAAGARRAGWRLLAVAGALASLAGQAAAQDPARISGRVTSQDGSAVPAATVFIQSLNMGAQTQDDGRYTLSVPGARAQGPAVITVRRIGFKPATQTITLAPGAVIAQDFVLEATSVQLAEVVVTGAGTTSTREKLGNTINSVKAEEIVRSNEANVVNALAAKAPNVEVQSSSGEPGAGSYIRIRGASTIEGTGQPLFVVDGTPIDNSTVATGSYVASTVATNRAADINPADIESIEILKGAAAAAIYGARAAQGVVLITTKSGKAGETRYSLRSSYSWDDVTQGPALQRTFGLGSQDVNGIPQSAVCDGPGCVMTSNTWGPALPAGTPTYDHWGELFRTGHTFDNTLTISGGSEKTTFFLSAGRSDQDGVMVGPNNWYDRTTVRVKGTHALTDRFHIGGNVSYVDARGAFIQKGSNVNGFLFGGLRAPPEFDNRQWRDPVSGLHRSYRYPQPLPDGTDLEVSRGSDNPFFTAYENPATSDVGRVFGNVNADYSPLDWLTVKWTLGADYSNDERLEGFAKSNASYPTGYLTRASFTNYQIDHNLTATAERTFSPNLGGTLTLGHNLNSRRFQQSYITGYDMLAPEPFNLNNVLTLIPSDYESLVHTESFFGQATVDLFDQLYLTAALRNDGFSTFGKESGQRHWFPKVSGAWTFSKVTGDFGGTLDFAKLRLAYGEAGREPSPYQTLSGYTFSSLFDGGWGPFLNPYLGGYGGYYSSSVRGQDRLKPERTKEVEAGIDVGVLGDLADASVTFYNRRSEDVIFSSPLSPATGYTSQVNNAAVIRNRGWEAQLNVRPLRRENLAWEVGLNWATNDNEVLDLSGAEYVVIPGSFTTPAAVAQKGSRLGVLRGFDFVRCGRGITLADGRDVDALCGDAPSGAMFIDADGFPLLDPQERVIMDPSPDWTAGIRNTFTIRKNLTVSSLLDIKQGGQVWNGTRYVLTYRGLHKDTEIRGQERTFGTDYLKGAVAGPGASTPVVLDQNWFQGLGSLPEAMYVEDGSYVKLREISVAYTLDQPWVRRATGLSSIDLRLAGRNLKTWTDYTGIDPETNLGGSEVQLRGVDYFNNPQTRSFILSVGLNR
jgi:TonB-linked SusC/RagA family outer membrane protein